MNSLGVLDWRELAPPQQTHECDCSYCQEKGELEPVQWPLLVTFDLDGVSYVSDGLMAIRADLAPVPDGYEGTVRAVKNAPPGPAKGAAPLRTQAYGVHFRWHVMKAIDATGWQLRLLDHPEDAPDNERFLHAVFAADNTTHIGWAMAAREPQDDYWSESFTREYGDDDD